MEQNVDVELLSLYVCLTRESELRLAVAEAQPWAPRISGWGEVGQVGSGGLGRRSRQMCLVGVEEGAGYMTHLIMKGTRGPFRGETDGQQPTLPRRSPSTSMRLGLAYLAGWQGGYKGHGSAASSSVGLTD